MMSTVLLQLLLYFKELYNCHVSVRKQILYNDYSLEVLLTVRLLPVQVFEHNKKQCPKAMVTCSFEHFGCKTEVGNLTLSKGRQLTQMFTEFLPRYQICLRVTIFDGNYNFMELVVNCNI